MRVILGSNTHQVLCFLFNLMEYYGFTLSAWSQIEGDPVAVDQV